MIFITLGSQKFQFNRLLKEVDELIENEIIKGEVFAQIGSSDYKPKNYEFKEFLNRDEFSSYIKKCNLVITHGGTGAIIGAIKRGKKVIAIPRLKEFNEHVDNHQEEIINQFKEMNLIYAVNDINTLKDAINNIHNRIFNVYESNTENILKSIDEFITRI